jgi:hypothetical protein
MACVHRGARRGVSLTTARLVGLLSGMMPFYSAASTEILIGLGYLGGASGLPWVEADFAEKEKTGRNFSELDYRLCSFPNFSAAASSVSSFLQNAKRTWRAPSRASR